MNKYLSLFKISIKRSLSNMPSIIAGTLVIFITSLLLVIGLYTYTSDRNIDIVKARIGLVNEDTSSESTLAFSYLSSMSSIKDIIEFQLFDTEEDALDALTDNRIVAYGYLPRGYIASVLNNTNDPLRIVVGELLPDTGAEYFFDVVDAAASDIGISQAAIYSSEDASYQIELRRSERRRINEEMNELFINTYLGREQMFDDVYLSNSKGLTLKEFYAGTLILLLVMLSGISFVSLIKPNSHELLATMKRSSIPLLDSLFTALVSSFGLTILITIIWGIVMKQFLFVPSLFLIVFSLFSFNSMLYRLLKDDTVTMLVISALSFVLIYLAGGIITVSYLPNILIAIGHNTHAGTAFELLKLLALGSNSLKGNLICILYAGIFSVGSYYLDNREVSKL